MPNEVLTLEAAKAKYGKLIVLEIDEKLLAFKPLNKAKVSDMKIQMTKSPQLVIDISINCCEFCCVVGAEHFKALADMYPLAFCGNEDAPGVIDALMDLARGGAKGPTIRVE